MNLYRYILVLVLYLAVLQVNSQVNPSAAQVAFENAEAAYAEGKYQDALEYLSNSEKLLGRENDKIQYLKILSLNKLFNQNLKYENFITLKKIAEKYLSTYDGDKDKYKEVYEISNIINKYPTDLSEFEIEMASIRKKVNDEEKLNYTKERLLQFKSDLEGVRLGMKWEELPSSAKNKLIKEKQYFEGWNGYSYHAPADKNYSTGLGISFIELDRHSHEVITINNILKIGKRKDAITLFQEFENMVTKLKETIGEEYLIIEKHNDSVLEKVTVKTTADINYYYCLVFTKWLKALNHTEISETVSLFPILKNM